MRANKTDLNRHGRHARHATTATTSAVELSRTVTAPETDGASNKPREQDVKSRDDP